MTILSTLPDEDDLRGITDPAEIVRSIRSPAAKPKVKEGLQSIRLRLAYRITRELALINGWIAEDQRLAELSENADLNDEVPFENDSEDVYWTVQPLSSRAQEIVDPLSPTRYLEDKCRNRRKVIKEMFNGLTILPEGLTTAEGHRWTLIITEITENMRLTTPVKVEDPNTRNYLNESPEDAFEVQQALDELITIPSSWPSKEEIMLFEENLIDFTIGLCLQRTRQKANNYLRQCVGLLNREATIVLSLARQKACTLTAGDVEEKRAMMELALEDLAERCRQENDRRTELGTRKALAVVQGIARAEIEDDNAIFSRVVRDAAAGLASPTRGRLLQAPEEEEQ